MKCYTFDVEKNIVILGYESLGCIKIVVLELPSLKYIFTYEGTMLSAVLDGINCKGKITFQLSHS